MSNLNFLEENAIYELIKYFLGTYLRLAYKHITIGWSVFGVLVVFFGYMSTTAYVVTANPEQVYQYKDLILFAIVYFGLVTITAVSIPYAIEYKETAKVTLF